MTVPSISYTGNTLDHSLLLIVRMWGIYVMGKRCAAWCRQGGGSLGFLNVLFGEGWVYIVCAFLLLKEIVLEIDVIGRVVAWWPPCSQLCLRMGHNP